MPKEPPSSPSRPVATDPYPKTSPLKAPRPIKLEHPDGYEDESQAPCLLEPTPTPHREASPIDGLRLQLRVAATPALALPPPAEEPALVPNGDERRDTPPPEPHEPEEAPSESDITPKPEEQDDDDDVKPEEEVVATFVVPDKLQGRYGRTWITFADSWKFFNIPSSRIEEVELPSVPYNGFYLSHVHALAEFDESVDDVDDAARQFLNKNIWVRLGRPDPHPLAPV